MSIRNHSSKILVSFLVLIGTSCAAVRAQQTWPGFRNDGSGIISVNKIPTKWSPKKGVAWQSAIPGYGQSAPVVYDGKIFVTSSEGPWQERCFVHAFDLDNGARLWTAEIEATTRVENYFRNSRAAPTCVVDDKRVVSFFPSGDVSALDHAGKKLWSVPLFKKNGKVNNERGTASSLAQTDDLVFAVVDHKGPSYVIALSKTDGSVVWKTDRNQHIESWASPVLAKLGDKQIVVVSSADSVCAYDALTGKELWHIDGMIGNHIPSASVVGSSVYVGSTRMYGSNGDPEKVAGSNCRIEMSIKNGKPTYKVKWGAERANSYYSSPLAFAGYVYYVNKSGVLFCVSQETGRRVFVHRIGNPCWASAVGVKTKSGDKYVFFVLKNGFTVVLRPGEKYDQVARNQLWDVEQMLAAQRTAAAKRKKNAVPTNQVKPKTGPEKMLAGMPEKSLHKMFSYGDPTAYAAAVVDGNLLIRTGQHLYCIRGSEVR